MSTNYGQTMLSLVAYLFVTLERLLVPALRDHTLGWIKAHYFNAIVRLVVTDDPNDPRPVVEFPGWLHRRLRLATLGVVYPAAGGCRCNLSARNTDAVPTMTKPPIVATGPTCLVMLMEKSYANYHFIAADDVNMVWAMQVLVENTQNSCAQGKTVVKKRCTVR